MSSICDVVGCIHYVNKHSFSNKYYAESDVYMTADMHEDLDILGGIYLFNFLKAIWQMI